MNTKSKINVEWHKQHPMPPKANFEQRVEWHRQHQLCCSCRPGFPAKLREEMEKQGVKI